LRAVVRHFFPFIAADTSALSVAADSAADKFYFILFLKP
jgi:hypothetical protein